MYPAARVAHGFESDPRANTAFFPDHTGANRVTSQSRSRSIWLSALLLGLALLCGPAKAGVLQQFHYASPALGRDQSAMVYVPSSTRRENWPVLYLLHGRNGSAGDWDRLADIKAVLDRMIEEKRIRPLLVVMPEGENSWYVDSAAVGGPGDFGTDIQRDLPAAIEAAFPVATDRLHRAIAGLSMGGYGALRIALTNPDRYGAVAALSPAIWQNIPLKAAPATDAEGAPLYFRWVDPSTVTVGIDLPPGGSHFGGAFGTPFDPARFNDQNVFTALQRALRAKKRLPSIFLSVGDDDSHLLWRGSIAFFETMQASGRSMDFRVTDGDHNWTLWKQSMIDAIVFVDQILGRAAVR